MRKKYLLFAGIVLLCFVAFGLYEYNKPHASVKDLNTDIIIDESDLYNQYEKDETEADKKYSGKIIEVKGIVNDVEKTDSTFSILLKPAEAIGGINCNLAIADNNKLDVPQKGASVIIKGKCAGFLMDVTLTDCVLKN